MKKETRQRKQLEEVRMWLGYARTILEPSAVAGSMGSFYLLVAVEQLVKYLEEDKS